MNDEKLKKVSRVMSGADLTDEQRAEFRRKHIEGLYTTRQELRADIEKIESAADGKRRYLWDIEHQLRLQGEKL